MVNITVWSAFYHALRTYNMTTIFGNPGSTEQPLLSNFPSDFQYILGLQEASVVAMADGYAQATKQTTMVVLHSVAGTGNGMGNIMTAFLDKTPLVIIAGQQTRQMVIGDPFLTNRQPELLPLPWVKWAYQPVRAEDVPAALIRAIAIASMPPAGPVYLSIPLDDWTHELESMPETRTVSTAYAPDPQRLSKFAARISKANKFALIYGEEIDKSLGWDAGVRLAELLNVPVYQAPLSSRAVFPVNHPLYRGPLPIAQGALAKALTGYDLVLIVGAEVYRYYPWVAGPVSPPGLEVLQITNDPHDAASARVGDSLLSDARLALESLYPLLKDSAPLSSNGTAHASATAFSAADHSTPNTSTSVMTPAEAFDTVALLRAKSDLLVQETSSNLVELLSAWPIVEQETYFASASGGLGWGLPASIGVALAQINRTTISVIGDGALQYSIQSIYTAVQHKAKVIILVPKNEEYLVLKEFAVFENTPNCPALNIPGLNAVGIAESYGCKAYYADTSADLYDAFQQARLLDGPALIEFQVNPKVLPLAI